MRSLFIAALLLASSSALAKKKDNRPDTMSIGIGAGLTVPSSPIGIDTGSVRVRVSDELTVEPSVTYQTWEGSTEFEMGKESTKDEASGSSAGLDALVRYTLADRGRVDLQGLGGVGYVKSTTEDDPEGKNNNTVTTETTATLDLGVGLEAFFNGNWSVSADAITRAYLKSSSITDTEAEEKDYETTTTYEGSGFALPLDPSVRVMFHLYF